MKVERKVHVYANFMGDLKRNIIFTQPQRSVKVY